MSKKDKKEPIGKMEKDMGEDWRKNDFRARPEAAGRKRNPFKDFVKEHAHLQVTPAEIQQAMEALLAADYSTLHSINDAPDVPLTLKIMAQQLLRAMDNEDPKDAELIIKMVERIMERIAGKAPQHVTVTQENHNAIDLSALTEDELLAFAQLQLKISQ